MDILIPVYDTTGVYEVKKNAKAFGGMALDGQVSPTSAKFVYYKFPIDYGIEAGATTGEVVKNFEKKIIDIVSVSYTASEDDTKNEVYVGSPIADYVTFAKAKVDELLQESAVQTKGLSLKISEDRRSITIVGEDTYKTKGTLGVLLLVEETIRQ